MKPLAEPVHEVKPGESCIYCACKHLSMAYSMALSGDDMALCAGELELARRHTLLEFPDIASAAASALVSYVQGNNDTARLAKAVELAVETADKSEPTDKEDVSTGSFTLESAPPADTMNPYIGAVHLYAAWRLASEIGYMIPNRAMIIGDLALAGEHLVRHDFSIETYLRNLRHRIQTRRSADLSKDWTATVSAVARLLAKNKTEYAAKYSEGLHAYLNFPLGV